MIKIISIILVGILISLYLFPVGLTFLPTFINSKNLLSAAALPILAIDLLQRREIRVELSLFGAFLLAVIFSLICLYAVDVNHTDDLSYARYIVSFLVWIFGAYTVCKAIEAVHGAATFRMLVMYLAMVSVAQCLFAIMVDRMPAFQLLVDSYIEQGQDFYKEVDRLYGIGASLDNAGVRFAGVLIMIMALISNDPVVRADRSYFLPLIFAFIVITVVGNMISRTTFIGSMLGLLLLLNSSGLLRLLLKPEFFKLYLTVAILLLVVLPIVIYFYNHDKEFHFQIRFAFEGFFNWIEEGEWRTDSTDKLNNTMWIWPDNLRTWIIGTGLFDDWIFGTDIGYCRFILYCGLAGFTVFALFFFYNAVVFAKQAPVYRDMFLCLLALTFIIWVKVSTDIFTFYALFYCSTSFSSAEILPKHLQKCGK